MRAIWIGGAALLLSACSSGGSCPKDYRPFSYIVIDATDFLRRHPGAELCLSPVSCGTDFETTVPLDAPPTGPTRLDITVRAPNGAILLHAAPAVRTHFDRVSRGCDEGSYFGSVTIDGDGSVST